MDKKIQLTVPELIRFRTTVLETVKDVMPKYFNESQVVRNAMEQAKNDMNDLIRREIQEASAAIKQEVSDSIAEIIVEDQLVRQIWYGQLAGIMLGLGLGIAVMYYVKK